jgi:hypothetical protein
LQLKKEIQMADITMADPKSPAPPATKPTEPKTKVGAKAVEGTITVEPLLPDDAMDGGHAVALWERDALHPGGEVYIVAGDGPTEVYPTALVNAKIRDGELKNVTP